MLNFMKDEENKIKEYFFKVETESEEKVFSEVLDFKG